MSNRKTDFQTGLKIVYSLRIHIELQKMGFQALTEMKNPQKPTLNCWVYEWTDEFQRAFDSLIKEDGEDG